MARIHRVSSTRTSYFVQRSSLPPCRGMYVLRASFSGSSPQISPQIIRKQWSTDYVSYEVQDNTGTT